MDKRILLGVYEYDWDKTDSIIIIAGIGKSRVLQVGSVEWKIIEEIIDNLVIFMDFDNILFKPDDEEYNKLWNILHGNY